MLTTLKLSAFILALFAVVFVIEYTQPGYFNNFGG